MKPISEFFFPIPQTPPQAKVVILLSSRRHIHAPNKNEIRNCIDPKRFLGTVAIVSVIIGNKKYSRSSDDSNNCF